MRFRMLMAAVVAIALAVGLQAGAGAAATKHGAARTLAAKRAGARSLAANRAAARSDAAALLARLSLPPGATATPDEPAGDAGWLKPEPSLIATTARATVHGWWLVPGGARAAFAYLRAHPPAGSRVSGTGWGSKPSSNPMRDIDFVWRPVPGVLNWRELQVTVVALGNGETGLLAQAQSDWVVPRPASERVPSGVREVDVTSGPLDAQPTRRLAITSRRTIRRLVSLLDSLPIVQPEAIACPLSTMSARARAITVTFRSTRVLARAYYADYVPLLGASGQCNPVQFTVLGRRRPALIGGDIVGRLQRILGTRLV